MTSETFRPGSDQAISVPIPTSASLESNWGFGVLTFLPKSLARLSSHHTRGSLSSTCLCGVGDSKTTHLRADGVATAIPLFTAGLTKTRPAKNPLVA